MNGGFGNRPLIGLSPDESWGKRILRDIKVLIKNRSPLLSTYDPTGHTLLWLPPWDGEKTSSIPIEACDPFFIEICRRIRFLKIDDHISCDRTNTKAGRVSTPDDLNGRTQDPWTPIEKKGVKALTLGESGFTYELIQQLLLGEEYTTPIALDFQHDEKEGAFLICQALVRGQGKTDGLHRRIIPIPPKVTTSLFSKSTAKEMLSKRAKERITLINDVQRKILRPALSNILSSGSDQKVEYEKVAPWINRFDQEIDRRFFESLWASVELEPEVAKRKWENILLEEAEKIFREAERSTPIAQLRRYRALSKARSMFYGQANKVFEYAGKRESVNQ